MMPEAALTFLLLAVVIVVIALLADYMIRRLSPDGELTWALRLGLLAVTLIGLLILLLRALRVI